MSLPKQSTPVYETTIPSTGKKIHFRPFLVKDKKALMIAQMSGDVSAMISTLREVIKNCVEEDINPKSLAPFDIEKLFCMIRAKSDGEIVKLNVQCKECSNDTPISLDVSTIDVKTNPEHKKEFILFNNVGVCMKYPTYEDVLSKNAESNKDTVDGIIQLICNCIEYIYDDKQMYSREDSTDEEMREFVENLTEEQLNKIKLFFDTMPKFAHVIDFKCPHCGNTEDIHFEGINNFF